MRATLILSDGHWFLINEIRKMESLRGEVANMFDCDFTVSEFEFQSPYFNYLGKAWTHYPPHKLWVI